MNVELRRRIPVCPHGHPDDFSAHLVALLDKAEKRVNFQLRYSSGFRCPACNTAAGGVRHSAHLTGEAVDILSTSSSARLTILRTFIELGCRRIGIGKSFIHVDVSETLPQEVCWIY